MESVERTLGLVTELECSLARFEYCANLVCGGNDSDDEELSTVKLVDDAEAIT